jgi:CheY-like chemotaxis protein
MRHAAGAHRATAQFGSDFAIQNAGKECAGLPGRPGGTSMYGWRQTGSTRGGGEDEGSPPASAVRRHDHIVTTTGTGTARILVVEDQDDVRRMLTTALEMDGHVVDGAPSAADGLRRLEHRRYDLVLTDYAMPGGTGTWMLREASRLGLMNGAMALIVTAHPNVQDLGNVPVVPKPLDLDRFLEQVRRILATESSPRAPRMQPGPGQRPGTRGVRHRVELVLYVSAASPASMQARQNLEQILGRFNHAQVKLSVCDLSREPLAGEADRIAFTPTLVKRHPEPRLWVLGSLREPQVVVDLLRVCGVEAAE